MVSKTNDKLILALPKGRILKEVLPVLKHAGIEPEAAFDDPDARQLQFATNVPEIEIIRARAFDVATFV
ncbi:MAG: ATP phosphoribosyltransferase, partial [Alphaproteobacteria bacterium]